MSKVTQYTHEFTGPATVTLAETGCMTGKGIIEIQDAAGNWTAYYQDGSIMTIGTQPETVTVDGAGDFRVKYTCRNCGDGTAGGTDTTVITSTAGACCDPGQATHVLTAGTDIDVPAGFHSVTITNLEGETSLDVAGGSFILSAATIPSLAITGQEHGVNGLLPAITITGTSWQWIGQDKL